MLIRTISAKEMDRALQIIWETFLQFEAPDFSQQGIDSFHDYISNKEIVESLEFFGAFYHNELRGVIATNDNGKHICCFFISADYQKRGIGRQLWEYLKENSGHAEFTVNSSPFAVPVYHRLGFADTDTEQIANGIRYTPMKFTRSV